VCVGDAVTVWPARLTTKVKRIVTWDGDLERAHAPMSVTLTLEDELDISRGDVLAIGDLDVGRRFEADIVWMDERPLDPARVYMLKHGATTVPAEISRAFTLNQIDSARVATSRPLVFDPYQANRATGAFILIDPATNFTAGAGMIVSRIPEHHAVDTGQGAAQRLARLARAASSDHEAVELVQRALEEILA
jgi:sulfate adenylyltransferase subunit 1 (EFTu-like GTPase family)